MRGILLILLSGTMVTPLAAQWRLSLAAGPATTSGHSLDGTQDDRPAILPDHPQPWTLTLARQVGAWRLGIDGSRITADLAVRSSTTSLATRGALSAWGTGVELAHRVAARRDGWALWGGVGAVYERWTFDVAGGDARWRAAARAALQLDIPLATHWDGLLRGELGAGPSLFRNGELPEGYQRRGARRAALLLGVTLAGAAR
ncbi:MAG: hypothetical protein ABJC19_06460 [Gemmatimonadota bacterium]